MSSVPRDRNLQETVAGFGPRVAAPKRNSQWEGCPGTKLLYRVLGSI